MALTYSVNPPQIVGTKRQVTGTITFDSSYATGGEDFDPETVGLVNLENLRVQTGRASTTTAYAVAWNRSTSAAKVQAFWVDTTTDGAPLQEATAATNLSGLVVDFVATGY